MPSPTRRYEQVFRKPIDNKINQLDSRFEYHPILPVDEIHIC